MTTYYQVLPASADIYTTAAQYVSLKAAEMAAKKVKEKFGLAIILTCIDINGLCDIVESRRV